MASLILLVRWSVAPVIAALSGHLDQRGDSARGSEMDVCARKVKIYYNSYA